MPEPNVVLVNTADTWSKVVSNRTFRKRIFLQKAKKEGCFTYNHHGYNLRWLERFKDLLLQVRGSGTELIYTEPDYSTGYETDVRGYAMALKLGEKTRVCNSGEAAILKLLDDIQPTAEDSAAKGFNRELLQRDGSANADAINGLGTINKFTTPSSAADRVAEPNLSSYAGRNCNLGASSGSSWSDTLAAAEQPNSTLSNDFPLGSGSADYDAASMLGVVDDANSWGTDSREWQDNCGVVLSDANDWQRNRRGGQDKGVQLWLAAIDRWTGYKRYQEAKFRNLIPHEEGRDLGFPETLKQDQTMIAPEYDMPAGQVFGINFQALEVCVWAHPSGDKRKSLFYVKGWDEDAKTGDLLMRLGFWGNTKLWPGGFVFVKSYSV